MLKKEQRVHLSGFRLGGSKLTAAKKLLERLLEIPTCSLSHAIKVIFFTELGQW